MGDRFYQQIGIKHNLKSVADIMAFCHRPASKQDKRTKPEIAASIGISGLDKLVKEQLLWLETNIADISTVIEGKLKKDYVSKLSIMFPEVDWNKLTLVTIKEVLTYGRKC